MSGYYYPPRSSPSEEEEFDFNQSYQVPSSQPQQPYQTYAGHPVAMVPSQRQIYSPPQQFYQSPPQYQQQLGFQPQPHQSQAGQQHGYQTHFYQSQAYQPQTYQSQQLVTPTVPSNYTTYVSPGMAQFPQYAESTAFPSGAATAGPSRARTSTGYLSPDEAERSRATRAMSLASNASDVSQSDVSRDVSPSASEMAKWGFRNENGSWSCGYPSCSSRSTFNRGCDLRKHYKRHTKTLFCRYDVCPQATGGGFSSTKDRARHEAKHNPNIACEWEGCDRLFSRVDNMKDHVRRVHKRKVTQ